MRCPSNIYEFNEHFVYDEQTLLVAVLHLHRWSTAQMESFCSFLQRNFVDRGLRVRMLLDGHPKLTVGLHLSLTCTRTIQAEPAETLFGKLLQSLCKMGLFVDGQLAAHLHSSIRCFRTVSFQALANYLKVEDACLILSSLLFSATFTQDGRLKMRMQLRMPQPSWHWSEPPII